MSEERGPRAWEAEKAAINEAYRDHIKKLFAVNPMDEEEIATAVWLCENIYIGACLPDAWVHPVPLASGFVWAVEGEANPENGHAYPALGYDGEVRCLIRMVEGDWWKADSKNSREGSRRTGNQASPYFVPFGEGIGRYNRYWTARLP